MTARDARILALSTLSRIIIVAGGRAAGVRLGGPPDTLPVLVWSESDDRTLIYARNKCLHWLSVNITGSSISLRPMQRVELKTIPLWLGWLSGSLAIFDVDERIQIYGDDYDKPLDLSHVEPVYASAFFKGHWTDGRVSQAMGAAGTSALGGVCVADGALSLLGRKGVVRVKMRDLLARAQAFCSSERYFHGLRLLCSTKGTEAKNLARSVIMNLSERPHLLNDKDVAEQAVKLCLKYKLCDELWNYLWQNGSGQKAFVEALGNATVRGDLCSLPPSPDSTQILIERLADFEPGLVERVVASLPLTSLDPHRASVFTRKKRLWGGVGAIAATLGGPSGAMRELISHVDPECSEQRAVDSECVCAGRALLLAAADALAGRGAGGRPLPDHAQPSARHDALITLLGESGDVGGSPLRVLVEHDASAAVRMLEQSAREPPFAGPLGKQNRLRVARELLSFIPQLPDKTHRIEILEFIAEQLSTGALPSVGELVKTAIELAADIDGERADRAWLAMLKQARPNSDLLLTTKDQAVNRPRVLWHTNALLGNHAEALDEFFRMDSASANDIDEFYEYIRTRLLDGDRRSILEPHLAKLVELNPRAAAAIVGDNFPEFITRILKSSSGFLVLEFAECLLEVGKLKGDAAAAHLRNLCICRPDEVTVFLTKNPEVIRPEDALSIVKEAKLAVAEPICLEATGDTEGALDAMFRLISSANAVGDKEMEAKMTESACELCRRLARTVPRATAADMWSNLLRRVTVAPSTIVLDAIAYLPADELIAKTCDSPEMALTILEYARQQKRMWVLAMRLTGREGHEALARALRAARRGLAVRGRCAYCGHHLAARPAVRTTHCACATHTDCEPELSCRACGQRIPSELLALPPRLTNQLLSPTWTGDHALRIVAPPRPDLEGII